MFMSRSNPLKLGEIISSDALIAFSGINSTLLLPNVSFILSFVMNMYELLIDVTRSGRFFSSLRSSLCRDISISGMLLSETNTLFGVKVNESNSDVSLTLATKVNWSTFKVEVETDSLNDSVRIPTFISVLFWYTKTKTKSTFSKAFDFW